MRSGYASDFHASAWKLFIGPTEKIIILAAIVAIGCLTSGCGCDDNENDDSLNDDIVDADDDADDEWCIDDTPGVEKVWLDESTGLMWETDPSCGARPQVSADICQGKKLAGYDDWRLPTISELRTLIRGCPSTEPGGACGITDDCTNGVDCSSETNCGCEPGDGPEGGCYGPSEISDYCTHYWSSSADLAGNGWIVNFYSGGIGLMSLDMGDNALTICVRSDI